MSDMLKKNPRTVPVRGGTIILYFFTYFFLSQYQACEEHPQYRTISYRKMQVGTVSLCDTVIFTYSPVRTQ